MGWAHFTFLITKFILVLTCYISPFLCLPSLFINELPFRVILCTLDKVYFYMNKDERRNKLIIINYSLLGYGSTNIDFVSVCNFIKV